MRRALTAPSARVRPRDHSDLPDVDVAIVCESTYPYLRGGLSAVVHQICAAHPELRFGIVHLAWDRDAPHEAIYALPPQVSWVLPLYQSMREHEDTFKALRVRDSGLGRADRRRVVDTLFAALDAHLDGDDGPLWQLYDEGIDPVHRRFLLWPLLSSYEFMQAATERFATSGMSLTRLFWQLREFFSLAYAVTDVVLPRAAVYHAHTTGAAGLLAAAGARQYGARFLLTEHNLYSRDTMNTLLGRSLATRVTLDEWRSLVTYESGGLAARTLSVTPTTRSWLAWFARSGVLEYRAADVVTYLYPDAIEEAADLGGLRDKSRVVPNGVLPEDFDAAREEFDDRRRRWNADRVWRLACAARLVPIKGQLDLLEALSLLLEAGIEDWELDFMGPEGEQPEYAALCRRRASELGLEGRVRFLGSVDLRTRLGGYDALVLPSHNEGQPIVVLEAMTVGLPTVGTDVGGMRQLVADVLDDGTGDPLGPCGELVEARDASGLAAALARLLQDPQRYDQLSRNGRLRVERRFHLRRAMGMYSAIYGELGAGAPAPLPVDEETSAVR